MSNKWAKDSCPYASDQGFYSVVGDIEEGETLFGFTHTQVGASDTITLATSTGGQVNVMADTDYQVEATKLSATSVSVTAVAYITSKSRTAFVLNGDAGDMYDVIIKGRVMP
jgi:hypothetical protein